MISDEQHFHIGVGDAPMTLADLLSIRHVALTDQPMVTLPLGRGHADPVYRLWLFHCSTWYPFASVVCLERPGWRGLDRRHLEKRGGPGRPGSLVLVGQSLADLCSD